MPVISRRSPSESPAHSSRISTLLVFIPATIAQGECQLGTPPYNLEKKLIHRVTHHQTGHIQVYVWPRIGHNTDMNHGTTVGAAYANDYHSRCFLIMPFSTTTTLHTENYWTELYESFLKPALKAQGFDVHRSQATTGKISKYIVQDLAYTDLVFAVLNYVL